jgi:hypothetical protein
MKCNIMSFAAQAACMGKICKLYLYRNGTDGWIPESVAVYDYTYPQGRPLGQANKARALGPIEICFYQRKRGLPKKKKPPSVKKEIRVLVLRA